MLRSLIPVTLAVVFTASSAAAVWPPKIGDQQLKSEEPVPIKTDRDLWTEYGFMSAAHADYGTFQATAYRFKDGTDAFAASRWMAATNSNTTVSGNYAITCQGQCPNDQVLKQIDLPSKRRTEDPLIWAYLPSQGMIANSGRYALGPLALQRFAPAIPAQAAAFQYGTEVTTAKYNTPKGEQQLILLSFPVPQMARQQAVELHKLSGAIVKRSGPLVAVIPNPADPALAAQLIAEINYRAQVSRDEQPPPKVTAQGVASMVLTIFKLAGVLIAFCLFAGLGFAALKVIRKRLGYENADEAMIVLHLVDR